jgi:hypothetical protein
MKIELLEPGIYIVHIFGPESANVAEIPSEALTAPIASEDRAMRYLTPAFAKIREMNKKPTEKTVGDDAA